MSADNKDGGPAFPGRWQEEVEGGFFGGNEPGMTLRDYFAAKAMQSFLDNLIRSGQGKLVDQLGLNAYRVADEMLKARNL